MATRIVITGANGHVGRAVLERLRNSFMETVAIARRAGSLPATRTLACGLDAPRTVRAIREADAVIHLAGSMNPVPTNSYYGANVATTAAVMRAARDSNVKRVVFLSGIGAHEASANEYLRTKAQAEELIRSLKIPSVIFRCTYIIGPPDNPGPTSQILLSHDGDIVKVLGSGRQMIAPVFLDDVVSAVVTALDKGKSGTYELAGPERMSMDELVRMMNRREDVSVEHLPERLGRFLPKIVPDLPAPLVEMMVKPCTGDPREAVREFAVSLTRLADVWRNCPRDEQEWLVEGRKEKDAFA